ASAAQGEHGGGDDRESTGHGGLLSGSRAEYIDCPLTPRAGTRSLGWVGFAACEGDHASMPGERILVVEDEVAVRDLLLDILESAGYRVMGAGNGEEGLVRMASAVPDLVVSDVNMPRMGGHAFCDAVRARPEWDRIPFIFLSGQGEQQDVIAGKRLGADD